LKALAKGVVFYAVVLENERSDENEKGTFVWKPRVFSTDIFLKCSKIIEGWGSAPRPFGELEKLLQTVCLAGRGVAAKLGEEGR